MDDSTYNIDTPDGWVQAPPERFETLLFVRRDTYDGGLFDGVSKGYVCVYDEESRHGVELDERGEKAFEYVDDPAEASRMAESMMEGDYRE